MPIGIGGVTSAISGLKIVEILEKMLQIPNIDRREVLRVDDVAERKANVYAKLSNHHQEHDNHSVLVEDDKENATDRRKRIRTEQSPLGANALSYHSSTNGRQGVGYTGNDNVDEDVTWNVFDVEAKNVEAERTG